MKNVANMMLMISKMTSPCILPALLYFEEIDNDESEIAVQQREWDFLIRPLTKFSSLFEILCFGRKNCTMNVFEGTRYIDTQYRQEKTEIEKNTIGRTVSGT